MKVSRSRYYCRPQDRRTWRWRLIDIINHRPRIATLTIPPTNPNQTRKPTTTSTESPKPATPTTRQSPKPSKPYPPKDTSTGPSHLMWLMITDRAIRGRRVIWVAGVTLWRVLGIGIRRIRRGGRLLRKPPRCIISRLPGGPMLIAIIIKGIQEKRVRLTPGWVGGISLAVSNPSRLRIRRLDRPRKMFLSDLLLLRNILQALTQQTTTLQFMTTSFRNMPLLQQLKRLHQQSNRLNFIRDPELTLITKSIRMIRLFIVEPMTFAINRQKEEFWSLKMMIRWKRLRKGWKKGKSNSRKERKIWEISVTANMTEGPTYPNKNHPQLPKGTHKPATLEQTNFSMAQNLLILSKRDNPYPALTSRNKYKDYQWK